MAKSRAHPGHWTPKAFVADDGSVPFERFLDDLPDVKFEAARAAIDRVLSVRGIELVRTEWMKPLGKGLHEFRVRHHAEEMRRMFGGDALPIRAFEGTVILRIFVQFHGERVVLLLGGYDKGSDPSARRQHREIAEARRLLAQFKRRPRTRESESRPTGKEDRRH